MTSVTLIPIAPEHATAVQRLASDPLVTATTNLPEPYPDGGAAWWIGDVSVRHEAGSEYAFAVLATPPSGAQAEAPELVGVCGLVMPDRNEPGAERVAEMGYWIGRPYWGRGYATAACRALVSFAFDHTAVDTIDAYPLAENAASRRVLEKTGARLVAIVPNKYPKWSPERVLAQYRIQRAGSA